MFKLQFGVFAASTTLFAAVLLLHNGRLFRQPIHDDGDLAANSLLIMQARRFELLVGNYSRMRFNHPGPAILYFAALGEAVLHDAFRLVPAPHNAHMVAALLLNALLLGLTQAVLFAHTRSRLAVLVAVALFLCYFGVTGALSSHWMPHIYEAIYLTFAVAVASVAAGNVGHAWLLALAGSLAVHGHVCFVAFVVPMTLFAAVCALARFRFRVRPFVKEHSRHLFLAGGVAALFVLPIVLDTVLHYPGEVGKYLRYARQASHEPRETAETAGFVVRCITSEAPYGVFLLAAAVVLPVALSGLKPVGGPRFVPMLLAVCAITVAVFLGYAARAVDNLEYTYTGYFAGTVLLLLLTAAALNVTATFENAAGARRALAGVCLVAGLVAAVAGRFTNTYEGASYVPRVIAALRQDPRWQAGPVVVSFAPQQWPEAAALFVELRRLGVRAYNAEHSHAFIFTPGLTCDAGVAGPALRIRVGGPETRTPGSIHADRDVFVTVLD
jgi:hypothetical protein